MGQRLIKAWYKLFSVSQHVIWLYYAIRFLRKKPGLRLLAPVLMYIQQVISGCHIHPSAQLGDNLTLPHPVGIVIGKNVVVENNVTIFQHVTLGSRIRNNGANNYPRVGSHAVLYADAIVIGAVNIGCYAVIGAAALVNKDVPPRGLAYGNPARLHGFVCDCGKKLAVIDIHNWKDYVLMACVECDRDYQIPKADFALLQVNT